MKKSIVNNQRGQFLIESLLIMLIAIGVLSYAVKIVRDKKLVATLVSGPWTKTAGMAESGHWSNPATARTKHPNTGDRGRLLNPGN
ncbi:MAG: hypothetical protein V4736_06630 [Bdellovibrionota bacterium]